MFTPLITPSPAALPLVSASLCASLVSFPTFHDFLIAFRHAPASSSPRFSLSLSLALALPLSLAFVFALALSLPPSYPPSSSPSLSFSLWRFSSLSRVLRLLAETNVSIFFIAELCSRQRAQVLGPLCRNICRKVLVMYSR